MQIQVVGLNHQTAPIEIRERVSLGPDQIAKAYTEGHPYLAIRGVVIVSTCNRTEVYWAGAATLAEILSWWEVLVGIPRGDFVDHLYWYANSEAYTHLFRVTSGLDSMVLGETQILGQIKASYQLANGYQAVGALHRLFQYALRVGKRAHGETGISHNALSVGHAVVELAKKVFGDLEPLTALVIGAGETGSLVARHLAASGVGNIVITSRTADHAHRLALDVKGVGVEFGRLTTAMREADIIVSSTSAPHPIITLEKARAAFKGQGQRLRFVFDLAVPRDVEPDVAKVGSGIFLYDVDDIEQIVVANYRQRQKEAIKVERIVQEERVALEEELGATEVGPVIRLLREKAELIRQQELSRAMQRLSTLTPEERSVVEETTRIMMNKFLNDPMTSMRRWGNDGGKAVYIDAIRELFRLREEKAPSITLPASGDIASREA